MKKYNYDEVGEYLRQLKNKKFIELEKKAQETNDGDDFDEYVDEVLMGKHFDIDNTDNGTGYCEMEYKLKKEELLNQLIKNRREDLDEYYNTYGMGGEDEDEDEMFHYTGMYEISDKELIEDYGNEEEIKLGNEIKGVK